MKSPMVPHFNFDQWHWRYLIALQVYSVEEGRHYSERWHSGPHCPVMGFAGNKVTQLCRMSLQWHNISTLPNNTGSLIEAKQHSLEVR